MRIDNNLVSLADTGKEYNNRLNGEQLSQDESIDDNIDDVSDVYSSETESQKNSEQKSQSNGIKLISKPKSGGPQ